MCVLSGALRRATQTRGVSPFWVINYFLKNYVTSEEAVSHNVLYYQHLSITDQVSFYANIMNNYQTCPVPLT